MPTLVVASLLFFLLPTLCLCQNAANRQRERTVHTIAANDYGFNGFRNYEQPQPNAPFWKSDELLPNVFPWLANNPKPMESAPQLTIKPPTQDLVNFLNGPDGKDGPMKHIMRILRILPPKDNNMALAPNGQPYPDLSGSISSLIPPRPPSIDQVCPFGAEPYFSRGQYLVCNPRNVSGCPVTYVCDRSGLLTEHICCKDRIPKIQSSTSWFSSQSSSTSSPITSSSTTESSTTSTSTTPKSSSTQAQSLFSASTPPNTSVWSVWVEWTSSPSPSTSTSTATTTTTTVEPSTSTTEKQEFLPSSKKPWNPFEPETNPSFPGPFPKLPTSQFPLQPYNKRIWQPIENRFEPQVPFGLGATPPPWDPKTIGLPSTPFVVDKNPSASIDSTSVSKKHETTEFPTVTLALNGVEVIPLTIGNVMSMPNGDFEWASTVTLIRDVDKTILVDTGVPADTNILIKELSKHNMRPDNIDMVVITHGHPDHFGNVNLFSRKRQLFSSFEFIGNKFSRTALVEQQFRKLTPHIEVWKTPGHTPEDLSVIVRDVPTLGTVAVVGDLILNEDFLLNSEQWTNVGSWDRQIQQNNINMIVCMADIIVPGHGAMFRLHDEHRKYANCAQRYPVYYANYYGK